MEAKVGKEFRACLFKGALLKEEKKDGNVERKPAKEVMLAALASRLLGGFRRFPPLFLPSATYCNTMSLARYRRRVNRGGRSPLSDQSRLSWKRCWLESEEFGRLETRRGN